MLLYGSTDGSTGIKECGKIRGYQSNKKIMTKWEMKLRRVSSHSYSITIPKEIINKFGWKERQKISVEELPGKVLRLKDWKRK